MPVCVFMLVREFWCFSENRIGVLFCSVEVCELMLVLEEYRVKTRSLCLCEAVQVGMLTIPKFSYRVMFSYEFVHFADPSLAPVCALFLHEYEVPCVNCGKPVKPGRFCQFCWTKN